MKTAFLRIFCLSFTCLTAFSQTPAPPAPQAEFEAASVRAASAHTMEELQRGIGQYAASTYPTGRFFMHNATIIILISQAYGVDGHFITNQPDWVGSQYYDVDATVEGEKALTHEEMEPLLQNLLAQRFHLKVHRESRIVPGFELVVAKGGPKLQPAKEGSRPKEMPASFHAQIYSTGFDGWDISIASFAHIIASPAGRPIVDKTGLTGQYDIKLRYADSDDPKSNLPDFFTAVQEQLGLKLEPAKVPVDYLVIDHIDKIPTEN